MAIAASSRGSARPRRPLGAGHAARRRRRRGPRAMRAATSCAGPIDARARRPSRRTPRPTARPPARLPRRGPCRRQARRCEAERLEVRVVLAQRGVQRDAHPGIVASLVDVVRDRDASGRHGDAQVATLRIRHATGPRSTACLHLPRRSNAVTTRGDRGCRRPPRPPSPSSPPATAPPWMGRRSGGSGGAGGSRRGRRASTRPRSARSAVARRA